MSSTALANREKWQDRANAGGAQHEKTVEEVFKEYFSRPEASHYEFISKPKVLNQLFFEVDYQKHPEKYAKPATLKQGDVFYDPVKKRFFEMGTGKKPKEARQGMIPDGMIRNKVTGKAHLLEEKKQNDAGNAHERGYRYDCQKIRSSIQAKLGVDCQPVSWIFAGSMTESRKYILEIQAHLPDNHYILLKANDNAQQVLIEWFNRVLKPLLD